MTTKQAIEYIKMRCQYETELCSYMQDETETGFFNFKQFMQFDDETKIAVAEDIKDSFRIEDYL